MLWRHTGSRVRMFCRQHDGRLYLRDDLYLGSEREEAEGTLDQDSSLYKACGSK
jgi:hypothetical protein